MRCSYSKPSHTSMLFDFTSSVTGWVCNPSCWYSFIVGQFEYPNYYCYLKDPLQPQAIWSLQSGKAPGMDGFCQIFIKHFQIKWKLCSVMFIWKSMLLWYFHKPCLRPQYDFKKDEDPQKCETYHPISLLNMENLLNVDYKILMKALAIFLRN